MFEAKSTTVTPDCGGGQLLDRLIYEACQRCECLGLPVHYGLKGEAHIQCKRANGGDAVEKR
jgi:hypothetical protein